MCGDGCSAELDWVRNRLSHRLAPRFRKNPKRGSVPGIEILAGHVVLVSHHRNQDCIYGIRQRSSAAFPR
jgi:hypothetical protein